MFSGHDGDMHSMDHGFDHDSDHHDGGQSSVSIFSFRVIVVFLTGFGAVGALCTYFKMDMLTSSFFGVVTGLILGFVSWWMMNFAMKQQASSLINTNELVGKDAIVHIPIPVNGLGEVVIELNGQRKYISARSKNTDKAIPINSQVKILSNSAGTLIVELEQ
jgi:membrane protein implicated in regulation of membrane protease activity